MLSIRINKYTFKVSALNENTNYYKSFVKRLSSESRNKYEVRLKLKTMIYHRMHIN